MGFFKKIFKGVKKVFKKIGKAIKGVFKKVGKFMGKIGIVGQLGLMLIAPYAMPMLGSMATSMMGSTMGGAFGSIVRGAGQFLNAAVKVGTRVGSAFKSVTSAVTGTLKNVVGATLNTVPGMDKFVANISGWDIGSLDFKTAFENSGKLWSNVGDDLSKLFSKSTLDSSMNKFGLQQSIAEGVQRTGALEVDPEKFKLDTDLGIDLQQQQQNVFPARSGLQYSESLAPAKDILPELTDYNTVLPTPQPPGAGSLLSPADLAQAGAQPSSLVQASDPFASMSIDVSDYAPTAQQAALPGAETIDAANKINAGVKTAYEANAWEKTKAFAKSKGLPTTAGGAAMYAAELAAYEPPEYEPIRATTDYVDYGSLATQSIYPTSDGLRYGNMLTPDPFDAPSLVDALMQGDLTSAYQYGYYGSPALLREMTR